MPRVLPGFLLLGLLLGSGPALGRPAEPPRLLYHSPADEMRLVNRFRLAHLPLRLLRIGVIRRGEACYGLARFLGAGATRPVLRRQALAMIRAGFRDFPALVQLDLVADDRPETRERRPTVLFTFSARRDRLPPPDSGCPPGRLLEACGTPWFRPEVPGDPPVAPTVAHALREALGPVNPAFQAARQRTSRSGS